MALKLRETIHENTSQILLAWLATTRICVLFRRSAKRSSKRSSVQRTIFSVVRMNVSHSYSLPLHANPRRIDPCINRDWIAVPITKTVIGLWRLSTDPLVKPLPLELNGHEREITALAFSRGKTKYLISACRDRVLIWDLLNEKDGHIRSQVFHSKPGDVTAMCINGSGDIIAIGVDFKVLILKAGKKDPIAVLDAHRGMITGLEFCPHYFATLASISDDRCFCIWDTKDMLLLYQSTILSPAPLISMCMSLTCPQVVIGSADGKLKVFDLTDNNNFRQLASMDVAVNLQKHFERTNDCKTSSAPLMVTKKGKQEVKPSTNEENYSSVQSSESVLSIQFMYYVQETDEPGDPIFLANQHSGVGDVLGERPPSICIITTNALVQINSRTFEILDVINLQRPINSHSFSSLRIVGSVSYATSCQIAPCLLIGIVGKMFEQNSDVIYWNLTDGTSQSSLSQERMDTKLKLDADIDELSVIPKCALENCSPLKTEMLPPVVSDPVTKGDVATGKKKVQSSMNQPLTFKSKVKSSGYSEAPRTTMFVPETSKKKLLNIGDHAKPKAGKVKTSVGKVLRGEYDTKRGPPSELCDSFQVDQQATAVFNLRFSDDGSMLGCSLANKCGLALKSPFSKHMFISYIGHNKILNNVYWSNDNSYLLTSSNDKTVSLWNREGGDPLMVLTHQKGTVKETKPGKDSSKSQQTAPALNRRLSSSSSTSSLTSIQDNKPFPKEIKHVQFFYVDKFILVTHGPTLSLYKYYVTPEKDEIRRYQSRNRYKLISTWQTHSSAFTSTTAVNSFYSHLVMCTTSGRSMEIYDLNKSVLAHTFMDCHSRPAHSITVNEGSCYASQSSEAHNVIATSAATDPIKLWDLRSRSNVHALQGHLNNAHACQIAFSPCGNYLATGSEDKTVYIYDLRTGTYCERLKGHTEIVTSLAYHPAYPLLATGSLNGKILFFKSK